MCDTPPQVRGTSPRTQTGIYGRISASVGRVGRTETGSRAHHTGPGNASACAGRTSCISAGRGCTWLYTRGCVGRGCRWCRISLYMEGMPGHSGNLCCTCGHMAEAFRMHWSNCRGLGNSRRCSSPIPRMPSLRRSLRRLSSICVHTAGPFHMLRYTWTAFSGNDCIGSTLPVWYARMLS